MSENNAVAKPSESRRDEAALLPPTDVIEDAGGITLYADLAGGPKDKLSLQVEAELDKGPMWGYLIDGHGLYAWGRDMAETRRHLEAFEFLLGCELELRTLKQ